MGIRRNDTVDAHAKRKLKTRPEESPRFAIAKERIT